MLTRKQSWRRESNGVRRNVHDFMYFEVILFTIFLPSTDNLTEPSPFVLSSIGS